MAKPIRAEPAVPASAPTSHPGALSCVSWASLLKVLIWAGFCTYVTIRIFTLDITGDEFPYPFPLSDLFSLKNIEEQLQPLIYALSTIAKDLFSFDVVTEIRLPCLPIFMLYGYAAARLTRHVRPAWLELLAFTALLSNPFALDFFSLQRGYGLSMMFILFSAGFVVEMLIGDPARRRRAEALAIWTGSFAVVSNLACLHYYLGLCLLMVGLSVDWRPLRTGWLRLRVWTDLIRRLWAANQVLLANGIMLGLFWLPRLILLVKGNALYSGGETGFLHDTVGSLVACSLYDIAAPAFHDIRAPNIVTLALAFGVAALSVVITLHAAWRRRVSVTYQACLVFSGLLLMMVLSIQAQHHLAGVRFIWERATLILLPLFVGQVVLYVAALGHPLGRALGVLLLGAYIALFPLNANLTHTWTWHMMSHTRQLLTDLERLRAEMGVETVIMGVSDPTKPKLQYYMDERGIKWLEWYPIDMYTRFNGQYQIHPESHFFFIWHKGGRLPAGLAGLPIEPVPGVDYSGAQCGLYRVKAGVDLSKLIQQQPAP